jgi:RIP metalloprotease RseP
MTEISSQPPVEHHGSALERLTGSRGLRLALLLGGLAYVASTRIWLFVLIIAIVLSVFLHEMGHFLMAKRNGMRVTEFFLGFGPRIWSFRRGETEYGLKLIPAGAYVRIIGMHGLEEVRPEHEERTYRSQPFLRRMPVVLAGPVVNIALGFLLLIVVFAGFGHPSDTKWQVRSVVDGSAAAKAGIEPGDRIVEFNGAPAGSFDEVSSLIRAHAGTSIDLTVERDGQTLTLPVQIGWTLDADGAKRLAPLEKGDTVIIVDGQPITFYSDLVGALQRYIGPVDISFIRGGSVFTTAVTGPIAMPIDGFRGFLGVGPQSVLEHSGIIESTGLAAGAFGDTIVGSVQGMGRIFSPTGLGNLATQVANGGASEGTAPASGSGGGSSLPGAGSGSADSSAQDRPMSLLGIVNVGTQLGEQQGWAGVLALLATVNIFLGLINLVPLLPFDGGHIAVACYEEIRSRIAKKPYRVDMSKLMPVTYVVVFLMIGLFMSTLYLDAVDPVQLTP